jgi:hypothetical protein
MNREKYPYIADKTFARFEFDSQGPNGTIKKIVDYFEIGESGLSDFYYCSYNALRVSCRGNQAFKFVLLQSLASGIRFKAGPGLMPESPP